MLAEVAGATIAFMVGLWVYSDALKRGKSSFSAITWGLATFMIMIVFLPLWLLIRPKTEVTQKDDNLIDYMPCPVCQRYIPRESTRCPKCNYQISNTLKVY